MKTRRLIAWLTLIVLLSACGPPSHEDPGDDGGTVEIPVCSGPGGTLDLDCPAPPNIPETAQQPDYDYFSWNTFIALNWPAVVPSSDNSYARGFANSAAHFTDTKGGDLSSLVVWETFKEKREIFDHGPDENMVTPDPTPPGKWRQAVNYLGNTSGDVLNCPGPGESPNQPIIFQPSKSLPDSLDETLEVLSEALETPSQLCQGYTSGPKATFCQQVPGHAVSPHVYKGLPTDSQPQPVRYEVKVNYDFFKYVVDNDFYKDSVKQAAADDSDAPIRLPYRSNSSTRPNGQPKEPAKPNPNAVLGYSAFECMEHNDDAPFDPNANPCLIGAVHTKSAWIPLYDEADYANYYTKKALYYVTDKEKQKPECEEGVFGLVGFHIIQRVHQSDGQKGIGGTFIFSSWEHKEVESGYNYVNYWDGRPLDAPNSAGFYPNPNAPDGPLPVTRQFNTILPNTQEVNEKVWAEIGARNPNSVWLNYRLIGTQFHPVDINAESPLVGTPFPVSDNDPTGIGQPLYMANLVSETNVGLQHFQGLPPTTVVNGKFAGKTPVVCPTDLATDGTCPKSIQSNTSAAFMRGSYNLAFGTLVDTTSGEEIEAKAYNMGGCMGCHGVAQLRGNSFSFVLLAGQAGADVDTQSTFTQQPPPDVQ